MQIANVTSLANVSGTKLIEKLMNDDEKLTETEINYSSEDDDVALVIDEKKVDIIKKKSEKNDESPDKSSGMTNISEESRPPKRINATTNSLITIPTSQSELKFRKKSHFRRTKMHFFYIFKSTKTHFLTFSKVQKHIFCYFKNGIKNPFLYRNNV